MDLVQVTILALIQGITEFLPISSSGHLVLPSQLLGWPDQGLAFDTAVHLGSLVAVVTFFFRDLARFINAGYQQLIMQRPSEDGQYAVCLLIASLPILPVGFVGRYLIEENFRSIEVIA
ncbi:MAG: undecaprenyl-diphosphate phosphatase, partial [Pseudomonadales bacterium]